MRRDIQNQNYWTQRGLIQTVRSEQQAQEGLLRIKAIYEQSLFNVQQEISNYYVKYSKQTGLAVDELTHILSGSEKADFLIKIQKRLKKLGFNYKDIYNPNYVNQISRLTAIRQQLYWEIMQLAPVEGEIAKQTFMRVAQTSYISTLQDLGVNITFGYASTKVAKEMLKKPFYNKLFSEYLWGHIDQFATRLQTTLGGALSMGQSYQKTIRQVQDQFGVAKRDSARVVLTESSFFYNQAKLQAYKEQGVEKYRYMATLDSRTSKICKKLNGKIFNLSEAEAGINYPPMHPYCRSYPEPIISASIDGRIRRQVAEYESGKKNT